MVSILISVYNYDPSQLLRDISGQLQGSEIKFEIIVGNDASDSIFMPVFSELEKIPGLVLFNSEENLGRSRMRNKLAEMAVHQYLVFIDGDAGLEGLNFINKYLDNTDPELVLCGGTAYHETPPLQIDQILRWKYGLKREARTAEIRNLKPYQSFSSFNFCLPKEVFLRIMFREDIVRYGHEDTIFGIDLELAGVKIRHLDNPLIHNGLDPAKIFLDKTKNGILNLVELEKKDEKSLPLDSYIRLLGRYNKLRKLGGRFLLNVISSLFGKSIRKNLLGNRPSLRYFDLYKLCILNEIKG